MGANRITMGRIVKPLDDSARLVADAAARVIAKAEEISLPDLPEKLVTSHAICFLSRAYIELRDQIRALHDLVDQTDPNDPIGTALTKIGLERRPPDWTVTAQGPRLVLTPTQVAELSGEQLVELYRRTMGGTLDFTKHEIFVVRVWDGMDGCWTDCTGDVGRDEALRVWAERTDGGAHHVSYSEIDYYAIFPGGTQMHWDGSEGREMHRTPRTIEETMRDEDFGALAAAAANAKDQK